LPSLDLPIDRPRPAVATFRGGYAAVRIDADLTRQLSELSRREGATLFMTLMAVFQVLLYRYSGQDDFAVGTVIADRDREELEQLIGFFVNTLVIRAKPQGALSFREHLARVRQTMLDAYKNAALPFERPVERLAPDRDLSRNPLYQVALRLSNVPLEDIVLPGVVAQQRDTMSFARLKFDLSFGITRSGDVLTIGAEYALDLFDATTIERML